jgi:hypothetical protein
MTSVNTTCRIWHDSGDSTSSVQNIIFSIWLMLIWICFPQWKKHLISIFLLETLQCYWLILMSQLIIHLWKLPLFTSIPLSSFWFIPSDFWCSESAFNIFHVCFTFEGLLPIKIKIDPIHQSTTEIEDIIITHLISI